MQLGDYIINPTSMDARMELLDFLKFNNFKYFDEFENFSSYDFRIIINILHKTYFYLNASAIDDKSISEIEFYDIINYYPDKEIVHKKLIKNNRLIYEGYTLNDKPYGIGTIYYNNGNIFRQGIFDVKGIIQGKEYYYNGNIKFEGFWEINKGYGPNSPDEGNYYSEDGELLYSGNFVIVKSGVGFPMVKYPKGFQIEPSNAPDIHYVMWGDLRYHDLVDDDF